MGAVGIIDVAFFHPISMIVNAFCVRLTTWWKRRVGTASLLVLTDAEEHAIKHAEAGVDVLIVSGREAGGYCGEVLTMLLIP